ncbi:tetraacyldisaccharide 4'-kinase [Marivibrio halodurans]|uniref:Tetraacyldisaccharide 4'-kinase n=1 Tax=Marivibrio halodurans TaxID=2039722 RepID=A0A8J7V3Z3_9PROT|nr:tetraacyldisaccharide 4'-kinase [Marivibrio halodurans]MBP5858900.1 tetraacyldisaccharide 4'-kinase [Marivibrio halodurans]
MKTPAHWRRDGAVARLLAPLGALYAGAGRLRRRLVTPYRAGLPVICVGNVTAGGAGKTPVVQALVALLSERGARPAILLRGHGGREAGPLRVDTARHGARDVGDEALLHAELAPTWIARDRAAGARAVEAARDDRGGPDILILDDGFQNPGLSHDLSFLVFDGAAGLGNGRMIPAGPLREPLADALARADAVVLVGADAGGLARRVPGGMPLTAARMTPRLPEGLSPGDRVVAFAGIGRPEKFFEALEGLGLAIVERVAFADHHPYSTHDLRDIADRARTARAVPVTTAKDAARLAGQDAAGILRGLRVVPATLSFERPDIVFTLLDRLLKHS